MIKSEHTYTCDACGKTSVSEDNIFLPEDWTEGRWVTTNGLSKSPEFQLCGECFKIPLRSNLKIKPAFLKMLSKWIKAP